MINPTLFIGLGTTGLKILEYLQEMVLEQYGTTKLPIFEYIVIDVDERRRAETPLWGTNEIQVLYILRLGILWPCGKLFIKDVDRI